MALRSPASASPMNSQFFFPAAVGRMAFSRLLSISIRPSSRYTNKLKDNQMFRRHRNINIKAVPSNPTGRRPDATP